jgi:ribulose 1,5-bisphosphate synthetase/thiazole synthase
MELDGKTITANETLQADICIIGAGTAGITLAHEFINHGVKLSCWKVEDLNWRSSHNCSVSEKM